MVLSGGTFACIDCCVRVICQVQGLGFRVQGSGFRVQGLGFRVAACVSSAWSICYRKRSFPQKRPVSPRNRFLFQSSECLFTLHLSLHASTGGNNSCLLPAIQVLLHIAYINPRHVQTLPGATPPSASPHPDAWQGLMYTICICKSKLYACACIHTYTYVFI